MTAAVEYRTLSEWDDLEDAARIVVAIWDDPRLAPPSLLRAYTHFGNPVIGAFTDGKLTGVSIGFLAPAGGVHLHSHITGVLPEHHHLGVGFGLKATQRKWCLDRSIDLVTWTFDPLLARNAYFNMRKLGAVARALLPGFYGEMDDAINAGDVTDRLEVHWKLTSSRVAQAMDAAGPGAPVGAGVTLTVAIPPDYEAVRRSDPRAARATRDRVREELAGAFAAGLEIVDFTDAGYCFAPPGG